MCEFVRKTVHLSFVVAGLLHFFAGKGILLSLTFEDMHIVLCVKWFVHAKNSNKVFAKKRRMSSCCDRLKCEYVFDVIETGFSSAYIVCVSLSQKNTSSLNTLFCCACCRSFALKFVCCRFFLRCICRGHVHVQRTLKHTIKMSPSIVFRRKCKSISFAPSSAVPLRFMPLSTMYIIYGIV